MRILAMVGILSLALHAADKPNIVYVLCDDLGYGDVKALNPESKIATPNVDRFAREGMTFTDAHSSSAVCSPTRYALLTGRYNWRSRLQNGVLGGLSPHLIDPGRLTVPALLKQNGYWTACVGKWHLGMDWVKVEGKKVNELGIENAQQSRNVDYDKPIADGPTARGFDYYFGISASLDMIPYTFIENDRVTVSPTKENSFPMMLGREGGKTRHGAAADNFDATDVLPALTKKAVELINTRAADAKNGKPFFLYLPLNAPHTPILPTKEWQGKSGLNPYGDFVMQVDASFGEVLAALERNGVVENTLVIFTSDNGCSPSARFDELIAKGHNPSAKLRGTKADIFDGGHRIPFIARWPGKIKENSKSDQVVCLVDLMATCAEIIGAKLPDEGGVDSVSILPTLLGKDDHPLREALVHHSINGSFAIRQGNWKLELCGGSGGWSAPKPGTPAEKKLPAVQLYDLANDLGEQQNLYEKYPEIVERLTKLLEKYIADGRSTPGAPQKNDVPIKLRKDVANAKQPAGD